MRGICLQKPFKQDLSVRFSFSYGSTLLLNLNALANELLVINFNFQYFSDEIPYVGILDTNEDWGL